MLTNVGEWKMATIKGTIGISLTEAYGKRWINNLLTTLK